MEYGTLRVTTPDGQVREYPLETPSVTIGRSPGIGVTIDHVSVSRRHAQLRVEDGKVFVQDLGSASGTFIGSKRAAPEESHLVAEGQLLRFGDCEAQFFSPMGGEAGAASDEGAEGEGPATIAVSLSSPTQPVAAGGTTTATVVVQNRGKVVDQVSLAVPDLPAEWVQVRRPQLSLVAGARDEVTIVFNPPKTPGSTAGEHTFAVAAISREQGREVRVLGKFTILPFEGMSLEMRARGGKGEHVITLKNTGNVPAAFELSAADDEDGLNYQFQREELELAAGEEATITLKVVPKRRNPFGSNKPYRFRVEATQTGGGSGKAGANGAYTYRAPLRRWRYALFPSTAAIVLIAVALLGRNGSLPGLGGSGSNPTATATAASTATPSAAATDAPVGLRVGVQATIVNSPTGDCLRVRTQPSLAATNEPIGQLCDGQVVTITEGPTEADGWKWWGVDDGAGLKGWAAEIASDGSGVPFMVLAD
jgi:pSer/pThr/pTyr-binding forkhead associated (FHA) protein